MYPLVCSIETYFAIVLGKGKEPIKSNPCGAESGISQTAQLIDPLGFSCNQLHHQSFDISIWLECIALSTFLGLNIWKSNSSRPLLSGDGATCSRTWNTACPGKYRQWTDVCYCPIWWLFLCPVLMVTSGSTKTSPL